MILATLYLFIGQKAQRGSRISKIYYTGKIYK